MQWFYKALKIAVLILPMAAANAETLRSEPLETDAAFRFYAGIDGDDAYVVYQMPPGIYLYRERLQLTTATPGFSLDEMRLSPGKIHDDPFFGKTEVYYTAVTLRSKINGTGQFELAAVRKVAMNKSESVIRRAMILLCCNLMASAMTVSTITAAALLRTKSTKRQKSLSKAICFGLLSPFSVLACCCLLPLASCRWFRFYSESSPAADASHP